MFTPQEVKEKLPETREYVLTAIIDLGEDYTTEWLYAHDHGLDTVNAQRSVKRYLEAKADGIRDLWIALGGDPEEIASILEP